jgi:hypothetical protein
VNRNRSDRGQVLPFIALVIVLAGLAAVVIGRLGQGAVDRARARTAADAAALAGAAEGEDAARRLAEANHGTLLSFRVEGPDVEVVVRVRKAQALARARRDRAPGPVPTATGPPSLPR